MNMIANIFLTRCKMYFFPLKLDCWSHPLIYTIQPLNYETLRKTFRENRTKMIFDCLHCAGFSARSMCWERHKNRWSGAVRRGSCSMTPHLEKQRLIIRQKQLLPRLLTAQACNLSTGRTRPRWNPSN